MLFSADTVYTYIEREIIGKGYFVDQIIKDGGNYTFLIHKLPRE